MDKDDYLLINNYQNIHEQISSHLHTKPWQIAITKDKSIPVRKWKHVGTVWAASAISAVHQINKKIIMQVEPVDNESAVYYCSDKSFVRVK